MTTTIPSHPPLDAAELAALEHWHPENLAYLADRAAEHGLSAAELLAEFAVDHRSEAFVSAVLPDLEISHVIPRSLDPTLADHPGNILLELRQDLGGLNQVRGGRPMDSAEILDVHSQTELYLDARSAELIGGDPATLGQGIGEIPEASIDPAELSEQLEAAFSAAGWQEGLSHMSDHVLSFLADLGVPIAAVVARGASSVWPFLRSINWRRFQADWRYRLQCLARAMKAWREGGWKEACKALVLGMMIAMAPGMSTFVAALGLTGIAALGVRWLANRTFMRGTPLAWVLHRVADVLTACQRFLAQVFRLIEKVVDVVVEAATRTAKHVVTAVSAGAQQVMTVCRSIASSAVRATHMAFTTTARVAHGLFSWIRGWFGGGGQRLAPAMT